mmetsp:Transcript_159752/g.512661  ORF Transcript_159752/g.512661 Transcript_159752/m.512661 type:complete len:217 (-) Transcript_159752:5126-5776(-)
MVAVSTCLGATLGVALGGQVGFVASRTTERYMLLWQLNSSTPKTSKVASVKPPQVKYNFSAATSQSNCGSAGKSDPSQTSQSPPMSGSTSSFGAKIATLDRFMTAGKSKDNRPSLRTTMAILEGLNMSTNAWPSLYAKPSGKSYSAELSSALGFAVNLSTTSIAEGPGCVSQASLLLNFQYASSSFGPFRTFAAWSLGVRKAGHDRRMRIMARVVW